MMFRSFSRPNARHRLVVSTKTQERRSGSMTCPTRATGEGSAAYRPRGLSRSAARCKHSFTITDTMSTATQTRTTLEAQPIPVVEQHELRQIRRLATGSNAAVQAAPGSAPTPQDEPTPAPWTKLFGAGFSFFCAGVNDGTLGPLIPYILVSFSISTGEIAIL